MTMTMKRKSWQDYQKEIADDHYYYARSCIRQNFFPGSEKLFIDMLRNDLGKDLSDDPKHSSCTGIGYHSDIVPLETIMTVVARQFALMGEAGYENLVTSCITSFGVYTEILARVPRDGGEDAREPLEGDPARVQEAREPGPHVGCRVPFPRRDRRAGQKTARQRRDGRTAEGRRAHRLPLRQDISEIRDRRIGIPLCAGRHGRVVGRRVRRLSRTPPLLRIRVPQLPRAGQPRLFDRQLAQETGEHGALQARFHRGQLSGLRDVP